MENLGQEFSSPLLSDLLRQRGEAMKQLSELNIQLSKTKALKRGGVKKAIRNVEQALKAIDKAIDKERNDLVRMGKVETDQTLASQGIDARSGRLNAVGGMVASGAQIASSIMGAGGVSAIGVEKQKAKGAIGVAEALTESEQAKAGAKVGMSKYLMYGVIAIVIIFLLMRKK
jgi:cobalamin biosynthesis Mg chelatase CobN